MRHFTALLLTLFTLLAPSQAYAADCSRDDIDHYLDKGFDHKQVMKLCGDKAPSKSTSSAKSEMVTTTETRTGYSDKSDDAIFLSTAIEAYDVAVNDEYISFKRETCVNFGWEDWNGFGERACPHVFYNIKRTGLQIVDRKKGFQFFSAGSLSISGSIDGAILDIERFKTKHQSQILDSIKASTAPLTIDIRSGMPASRVEAVLRKLAIK